MCHNVYEWRDRLIATLPCPAHNKHDLPTRVQHYRHGHYLLVKLSTAVYFLLTRRRSGRSSYS